MTPRALLVAGLLSAGTGLAFAAPQPAPRPDVRLERLERWLSAAFHHSPGLIDDRIADVGRWSSASLQVVYIDAWTVTRLIREPGLAVRSRSLTIFVTGRRPDGPPVVPYTLPLVRPAGATRPIPYTAPQVERLKQIACAVGGLTEAAPCEWTMPLIAADEGLMSLSAAAAAVRRDANANFIVRRGALMHSDVAMMGLALPESVTASPGRQSVRMSFSDGRQTALTEPDIHWEIARGLLDLVAGPGTMKPAPAADAMVRRWYVATAAWMQLGGHLGNGHLERGRVLFPDDPALALLSGAEHEANATPAVQTAVRLATLPVGVTLAVDSEKAEWRTAERLLRRALELKPDLAEAHVRLGRILSVTGREADAVEHLKSGVSGTDETVLQYDGSLFLGATEEKLGHDAAAREAYERAAGLYPNAQSPHLGLSELARRGGHRDVALGEMEKVYQLEAGDRLDDPWWTYTYAQGRNADALLDALQKPFRVADAP